MFIDEIQALLLFAKVFSFPIGCLKRCPCGLTEKHDVRDFHTKMQQERTLKLVRDPVPWCSPLWKGKRTYLFDVAFLFLYLLFWLFAI